MKKNTIKLLGLSMASLLVITGCGKVPKLENGQDAVVTLKGEDISVDDLYNDVKERYALQSLLNLIDTEILNKKYKDTSEIKQSVKDQIDIMVKQYGGGDQNKLLQQTSSAWGVDTIDELTDYLTVEFKREKAIKDYAKSLVSDSDINDYYDEYIFGDISAKHILITPDVDANATDAQKSDAEKAALKEAKEVISKLNNGEDFDKLAKEYSDDNSTKEKGGLLADFVHDDMEDEFEEAAKNLENGKYTTEPVKTTYGYHIIYKVSQKDKPKLKTVKDDIIEKLSSKKLTDDPTIQVTAIEKLREEYNVKIHDDSLKDQYKRYLKNSKKQLSGE